MAGGSAVAPAGLWLKTTGSKATIDVYDPKTIEERRAVADRCAIELAYGIPTYVDEIDDHVSQAYATMPTRLYLVRKDGRIAYVGSLGPWGFKPDELSEAIDKYLAEDG